MNEVHGVIHGRTIELDAAPELPDGERVVVTIERLPEVEQRREALLRAYGGWADEADEVEAFLRWNREQRQADRSEIGE